MPKDRIIIPFTLKAYLANNTYADTYKPPRWFPDYTKVCNSALGANVTPAPFTEYKSCLKAGVHLHFILPAAFRHGTANENSYDFPTVPNRYVITRMYEQDGNIQVKCFVVESDFIKDRLDEGENIEDYSVIPYLKDTEKEDAFPHPYRFMGRWYEAGNVPPKGSYLDEELTVILGGDPMFAAYYPTCRSVFGWYDALEGVPDECELAYFVLGYYEDASKDPFFGVKSPEDFKKVLDSYNFTVDGEDVCSGCVFFGEALNIGWKGRNYPYPDMNPPDGKTNISFGYTSADAMSAVLAEAFAPQNDSPMSKEELEYNLTKLQYDLLKQQDQEDGNFKIDDEIHKRNFRETDPLEEYDELSLKEKSDGAPPNLDAYFELRRLQREAGRAERMLSFTRKKLYYMWETYIRRCEAHSPNAAEALQEVNRLAEQLSDSSKLVTERNRLKEETKQKRGEVKDKLPPEYELKTVTAAPFVIPKDPVLMLSGNGINPEYVFDSKTADGSLCCHFLPQPLNEPSIEDVMKKCVGLPSEFLPFDYCPLLYQAVINSPVLLKIFTSRSQEENPLSNAVNKSPLELSQLFMDWQVCFGCTEDKASLRNWDFEFGRTDYTLCGGMTERQIYVNGRIPLTPHAHKVLADRLNEYQEQFDDLREKLHDLPFISQELSGFTNELTGLRQVFQLPVGYDGCDISKKVEKLVEKHRLSVCGTKLIPLRGGFLTLTGLTIAGTFGQKQILVKNSIRNKAPAVIPYIFPYHLAYYQIGGVLFTPAFTSEARLTAEFTSANLTSDCSPICATLLPELINKRLILYDENGEYAGMLKTVFRNGKSGNIYVSSGSELNPVLKGFIDGIMQNSESLPSLIALIEDKLNKTVRTCQNDFIWGVPLVLAQLRVCFEFFGGAEYSKTDDDLGAYDDKGTEKLKIPLKFGNIARVSDGTIGVYDNGVFSEIHALWGADKNLFGSYVKEESPCISACDKEKIFTVLSVPESDLNIETGLLPVVKARISSMYTSAAEKIVPAAEINPILADADKIRLPISDGFEWQYKASPEGDETVSEIFPIENIISDNFITDGFIMKSQGKKR